MIRKYGTLNELPVFSDLMATVLGTREQAAAARARLDATAREPEPDDPPAADVAEPCKRGTPGCATTHDDPLDGCEPY